MINGLQYLVIFLVGFVLSTLTYFIGLKQSYAETDSIYLSVFDFSTLLPFYRNFAFMGPSWLDLPTIKSTLYGAIFVGCFCLLTLLLADLILYLYYKFGTS